MFSDFIEKDKKMKRFFFSLLLVCIFSLSACMQAPQSSPAPGETARPTDAVLSPAMPAANTPTQMPPAPSDVPTPVQVKPGGPELAAIQAMSAKYNIPVGDIQLIKSQPIAWPNGCLGVVLPGVMCTSQIVDGFKVTLEANGKQFEYHTNQNGTIALDAAQLLATIKLAVFGSNQTVSLVDPNIPLGPTYNPAFNGFLPSGGSVNGTANVLDFSKGPEAVAMDVNGTRSLSFIKKPTYALAVWRGGESSQPRLGWGTQPTDTSNPSILQISNADGTQIETLLTEPAVPSRPTQLLAEFWSVDGQSLYFSKEPVGIGGYIIFSGASNLYKIDISTKVVTELIPQGSGSGPMICLDALSGDYRFVADHCTKNVITIRDLNNNASTTIQTPSEVTGFNLVGSARFSPDGKRLAFAMAKGDPGDEQGWLAISDGTSGSSKLIYTSQAGTYFIIHGWLDDQTLLLESHNLKCNPTCDYELWTINVDGSNLTKVAQGSFLAIMDNR